MIRKMAQDLINFINRSPSPFHVIKSIKELATAAGFQQLNESETWRIKAGDKLFVTKNDSTIFLVTVGKKYRAGNGFIMLGAHSDSPCLKVKPRSNQCNEGLLQTGVMTYGGGIWYSWFDRELSVAGRVVTRDPADKLRLRSQLVSVQRPIMCIPTLCIHLNRELNEKWVINREQHLLPVLATEALAKQDQGHTHPLLLRILAEKLNCDPSAIVDFELYLHDANPARIGGALDEFIHAPRLDNQFNAFCGAQALVQAADQLDDETNMRLVCVFDNEEVGSQTAQGACTLWTQTILARLLNDFVADGLSTTFVPFVSPVD